MLDRLADLPDGYLRCVSANSYEEAVRIFWSVWIATGQFRGNSDALRVYVFRNFYYFEESENE